MNFQKFYSLTFMLNTFNSSSCKKEKKNQEILFFWFFEIPICMTKNQKNFVFFGHMSKTKLPLRPSLNYVSTILYFFIPTHHTASIWRLRWQFWMQSVIVATKNLTFFEVKLVPYASLCLENRVRSCVSSPFSRCTPILDWSE